MTLKDNSNKMGTTTTNWSQDSVNSMIIIIISVNKISYIWIENINSIIILP